MISRESVLGKGNRRCKGPAVEAWHFRVTVADCHGQSQEGEGEAGRGGQGSAGGGWGGHLVLALWAMARTSALVLSKVGAREGSEWRGAGWDLGTGCSCRMDWVRGTVQKPRDPELLP